MLETVENQVEYIRTVAALRKETERFQLLLNVTHILPWEANCPISAFTYVGDQAPEMLGYPTEDWYQPDFGRPTFILTIAGERWPRPWSTQTRAITSSWNAE